LDERGRTPVPPQAAYQQVLAGMPAVDYTADELLYLPRNPRPHKVYGYSPVEQVMTTVNLALRRQASQLQHFTEGNVPEALIGVPTGWTVDQIKAFQLYWDSLHEGSLAQRRHAKFVPGDMKYQPTRDPSLKDEFDDWLARVVCYAFSLPPLALVREQTRATAETAAHGARADGLEPAKLWVKELVDTAIGRWWGWDDVEFAWVDEEALSPLERARIDAVSPEGRGAAARRGARRPRPPTLARAGGGGGCGGRRCGGGCWRGAEIQSVPPPLWPRRRPVLLGRGGGKRQFAPSRIINANGLALRS
jgi:hypothetical protein